MTAKKEKVVPMRKEIEMKTGEAEDIISHRHLDKLFTRQLPFKFNYWLNRALKAMRKELEVYFEEKKKLIEQHVVLKKDGNPEVMVRDGVQQFKFKNPASETTFREKISALRDEPMKLPGIYVLPADPDDPKFNELSGHEISIIIPLVDQTRF